MRLVWAGQLELELGIGFTPKKSQLRVDMQGQGTWDKGHDLYTIPYISKPSTLNYELITYLSSYPKLRMSRVVALISP